VRIKALFSLAVLGYAGLALAQATPGQNVVVEEKKTETVTVVVKETPKPPAFVFELHGFISTTGFFQDAPFNSYGQKALFVAGKYDADKPVFGFDLRQTRLNFSVRGPEILGGATPKAVVEFDMFGIDEVTVAGGSVYGDVSILPRIRVAYVELKWAHTTLQIGQQNMLTIGTIPQSLRGIAFPMTYAAGTVGWRAPGVWGWHTFGDDTKFELAWSVQRSQWANGSDLSPGGINAGYSSGLPAFEARARVFSKMFDFWLSGHWQTIDRNGPGVIAANSWTDMQTVLGTVGAKLNLGPLALAGSAWYGKNAGPLLGNIVQFPPLTASYQSNIFGYGVWGQVGMNVTKSLSAWFTYGLDHPQYQDIFAAGLNRMRNQNLIGMVRWQEGAFAMGAEWLYSRTTDKRFADPLTGNQITVSGNYYF
jgi:hypothetical protein